MRSKFCGWFRERWNSYATDENDVIFRDGCDSSPEDGLGKKRKKHLGHDGKGIGLSANLNVTCWRWKHLRV